MGSRQRGRERGMGSEKGERWEGERNEEHVKGREERQME